MQFLKDLKHKVNLQMQIYIFPWKNGKNAYKV